MSETIIEQIAIPIKKKRQYYLNFINKNKDRLEEKQICNICYGRYKYLNKSHHIRTNLHKRVLDAINNKLTI
jgi:hypothetical protein